MMKKDIEAESATAKRKGKGLTFESKMVLAATMIRNIGNYFKRPVLVITNNWFGNDGLWYRLDRGKNGQFHLLSRMRTNSVLYNFVPVSTGKRKAGRPRKYGLRLGSVSDFAPYWKQHNRSFMVFLYKKTREVQAYSQIVMLKTMKCPVRVIFVYRKTGYVALMTTDLTLSVEQIILGFALCRSKPHKNLSSKPYYAWLRSYMIYSFTGNFSLKPHTSEKVHKYARSLSSVMLIFYFVEIVYVFDSFRVLWFPWRLNKEPFCSDSTNAAISSIVKIPFVGC